MGHAAISISYDPLRRRFEPLRVLAAAGAVRVLEAEQNKDLSGGSDCPCYPLRMLAWSTSLSAVLWCGLILAGAALRTIWR